MGESDDKSQEIREKAAAIMNGTYAMGMRENHMSRLHGLAMGAFVGMISAAFLKQSVMLGAVTGGILGAILVSKS